MAEVIFPWRDAEFYDNRDPAEGATAGDRLHVDRSPDRLQSRATFPMIRWPYYSPEATNAMASRPFDLRNRLSAGSRSFRRWLVPRPPAALPFERLKMTSEDALATWEALRHTARGWPIIIGGEATYKALARDWTSGEQRAATWREGQGSLLQWQSPYAAICDEEIEVEEEEEACEWPYEALVQVAPDFARDIDGKRLEETYLLIIPCTHGEDVPIRLRWGSWNDCPSADYHAAVLGDWRIRYGAELVGIGRDTLNLRVARRPKTRDEALKVAHEQIGYCNDVFQGIGSAKDLAASLMVSDWWNFWWD